MSQATQMGHRGSYVPTSDAIGRHGYGITKSRKTASTGGGRAWSEEEEAYLLQTRLQKMPYKHIAAHLKKTELACRLHYHQLSHGSSRRKRAASMSSGGSSSSHPSPIPRTSMIPSPIYEHGTGASRSVSPPESAASPLGIPLPRILSASPRLPAILPKPVPTRHDTYRTPPQHHHHHNHHHQHTPTTPARQLRLDCSALPPPSHTPSSSSTNLLPTAPAPAQISSSYVPTTAASHTVDMTRLAAVYSAHRASFWAAVAADYGVGANPVVLEKAWCGAGVTGTGDFGRGGGVGATQTPISPVGSHEEYLCGSGGVGGGNKGAQGQGQGQGKQDRTRISAILGIDANPRSPSEREMVRRIEEERGVVVAMGVGA